MIFNCQYISFDNVKELHVIEGVLETLFFRTQLLVLFLQSDKFLIVSTMNFNGCVLSRFLYSTMHRVPSNSVTTPVMKKHV